MTRTQTEREHVNDDSAGAVNLSLHRRCREDALLALLLVAEALDGREAAAVSIAGLAARTASAKSQMRRRLDAALHFGWLREISPAVGPQPGTFGACPPVLAVTPAGWAALREAAAAAEARAAHFRAVAGRAVPAQQRGAA